ncbi:unnamed protein product [Amaranthus hypochondriacus]
MRHQTFPLSKLGIWLLLLVMFPALRLAHSTCVMFNFGDSNSDPGGLVAGLGINLGLPNGQQFFNRSTGRYCDGRLYIDFICQYLDIDLLSPYLESSGTDFSYGVNFATSGSSTKSSAGSPFSFSVQTVQFRHFLSRTRELRDDAGEGSMISDAEFSNAIYSIDIGQNDITLAFSTNSSYQYVISQIPSIIGRIEESIRALYIFGARKFWIYNTGPQGCLTQTLALQKRNDSELDGIGCLAVYNNATKAFNEGLRNLSNKLRSEIQDATFVYVDMYAIKYDLFANPQIYGFENPFMACCGVGGPPYNYVPGKACGRSPSATSCPDPSRSIIWDGLHFTEAANAVIASKILSVDYSEPSTMLESLCMNDMFPIQIPVSP